MGRAGYRRILLFRPFFTVFGPFSTFFFQNIFAPGGKIPRGRAGIGQNEISKRGGRAGVEALRACTEVAVGRAGTEGGRAGCGRIPLFRPFSPFSDHFSLFFPIFFCAKEKNFPRSRGDWPK